MQTDKEKAVAIVQLTSGSFVQGYDNLGEAEASSTDRNKRAEAMGLEARYEAVAVQ